MSRAFVVLTFLCATLRALGGEKVMAPAEIAARLELAADWQLAHPARHDPKDWVHGAFYAGLSAWADLAGNARFQREIVRIGDANAWRPGPDHYSADDQAVGQTYVEAFLRDTTKPERLAPLRASFDYVLSHPKELWYWCDALFMGPPAWARLAKATGNPVYLNYALEFWATTTRLLYDADEKLYFRDESFIAQRGATGRKIFWSRGNGWVLAGLARLLDFLPLDHPARPGLETQFRAMAERVAALQQPDGLWRSSLLEPETYPAKEASGSAFFCYALAWGINHGLLDRARFEPVVWRAWPAIAACLDADGRLHHVQPIGAAPGKFPADSSEPYGVGAFLLAGCEAYRLAGGVVPAPVSAEPRAWVAGADDRLRWCGFASRIAEPVLQSLAQRRLKARMPVEAAVPAERAECTHLEAIARLLAGIAPWLELGDDGTAEGLERARLAALARRAIDAATDPASPDFLNFNRGGQPLVDAAFLGQAILRAPHELGAKLQPRARANLAACLKSTRVIKPYQSNWLLFASMVEVTLQHLGEPRDEARLREGLDRFQEWYLGDGVYGDGPEFHWDYYNAFVIQPMLVEVLAVVGDEKPEWRAFREKVVLRAQRFAAVQERMIAPDGSFPVLGRSIAYRGGAMQGLAQAAWRHSLPDTVKPAQARRALNAVIQRTLAAPGTFDEHGWLRIGLAGHQPALAEHYISTGSLYLCSVIFLPLGLPATDPFWTDPSSATTWERAWRGEDLPADHALREER